MFWKQSSAAPTCIFQTSGQGSESLPCKNIWLGAHSLAARKCITIPLWVTQNWSRSKSSVRDIVNLHDLLYKGIVLVINGIEKFNLVMWPNPPQSKRREREPTGAARIQKTCGDISRTVLSCPSTPFIIPRLRLVTHFSRLVQPFCPAKPSI